MREFNTIIEAERAAIAAEIHDGLLPYLYASAAKLSAVRKSIDSAIDAPNAAFNQQLGERLADAAEWIDRSREVARSLMNGITYPPLALADPLAAARAFLDQFAGLPGADLDSDNQWPEISWGWNGEHSPLAGRLPNAAAIAVYRLTTEFTRNALRHANASHIEVVARISGETAVVQIIDNGRGFDPLGVDPSTSHGLALARQRAAVASVELNIESRCSDHADSQSDAKLGTRVTLKIPLPAANISKPQIEPEQQAPQ